MNCKQNKQEEFSREAKEQFLMKQEGVSEPSEAEGKPESAALLEGEEESAETPGEKVTQEAEDLHRYRQEAEEYKDRWLRAMAEVDNFRKRVARERDELIRFGNENVLREMILVVDNLERAFNHAHSNSGSIIEGIERILDQFKLSLKKFGVEPIQAKGAPFDPHLHEAVMQVESKELQPNTVVEEFEKGYMLNGRLLRPAKVSVSKLPQERVE